jgi:hypothetical protein
MITFHSKMKTFTSTLSCPKIGLHKIVKGTNVFGVL